MGLTTKFEFLNSIAFSLVQVTELLKLQEVQRSQEGDDDFIECNNMTIINLVLKVLGPTHERNLTVIMLFIQVRLLDVYMFRLILKVYES